MPSLARRYKLTILGTDMNLLEFKHEMNAKLLDFLVGYLNEKEEIMGNNMLLKTKGMRSLYFPSEFYWKLGKDKRKIDYLAVKGYTWKYNDSKNPEAHSVFRRFDRLIFLIPPTEEIDCFQLILVHLINKQMLIFCPLPQYEAKP